MNKKRYGLPILFSIGIYLMGSCNSNQITNTSEEFNVGGYPILNSYIEVEPGYPGQESETSSIGPIDSQFIPPAPEPSNGLGSLSALLYSPIQVQVIANTAYYLMPAIGTENSVPPIITGPNEKQGDIHDFTNENGFLSVNNIPPGNYYLVIWSPYSWILAEDNKGNPLLIEIDANSKNELEVINAPWP